MHEVASDRVRGALVRLDGYNVLTTVEAALAGGVILAARDGCFRDMASMHGSYRKVAETLPALEILGSLAEELGVQQCAWYLDRPVSNSGRLKQIMEELAARRAWNWSVQLVPDPDAVLVNGPELVATADSMVLGFCDAWFNFGATPCSAGCRRRTSWPSTRSEEDRARHGRMPMRRRSSRGGHNCRPVRAKKAGSTNRGLPAPGVISLYGDGSSIASAASSGPASAGLFPSSWFPRSSSRSKAKEGYLPNHRSGVV